MIRLRLSAFQTIMPAQFNVKSRIMSLSENYLPLHREGVGAGKLVFRQLSAKDPLQYRSIMIPCPQKVS